MDNLKGILHVEDEIVFRRRFRGVLEKEFAEIRMIGVGNGELAIRLIEEVHYALSLVITDIGLPGQNGNQVARKAFEKDIPIIILCGSPMDIAEDVAGKCRGIFNKPVSLDRIISRINSIITETQCITN